MLRKAKKDEKKTKATSKNDDKKVALSSKACGKNSTNQQVKDKGPKNDEKKMKATSKKDDKKPSATKSNHQDTKVPQKKHVYKTQKSYDSCEHDVSFQSRHPPLHSQRSVSEEKRLFDEKAMRKVGMRQKTGPPTRKTSEFNAIN